MSVVVIALLVLARASPTCGSQTCGQHARAADPDNDTVDMIVNEETCSEESHQLESVQEADASNNQLTTAPIETTASSGRCIPANRVWAVHTAVSHHLVTSVDALIEPVEIGSFDVTISGFVMQATHRGRALIRPGFELIDVFYVPGLRMNYISVPKVTEADYKVVFGNCRCLILEGDSVVLTGALCESGYIINYGAVDDDAIPSVMS